jgi:hypothetical protein
LAARKIHVVLLSENNTISWLKNHCWARIRKYIDLCTRVLARFSVGTEQHNGACSILHASNINKYRQPPPPTPREPYCVYGPRTAMQFQFCNPYHLGFGRRCGWVFRPNFLPKWSDRRRIASFAVYLNEVALHTHTKTSYFAS